LKVTYSTKTLRI